jgi:hypothetical protein
MNKFLSVLMISLFVFAVFASASVFAAGAKGDTQSNVANVEQPSTGQGLVAMNTTQSTGQYQQRQVPTDINCPSFFGTRLHSSFGGAGVP